MTLISTKSKSSRSTITIFTVDLQNIVANIIRMVSNVTYSSFLLVLFGMSASSWLINDACCNHMTPHSSLFSQLESIPHPLNIRTANSSTIFGHYIGSILTSNLLIPGGFNVPNLSYNLFFVGQLPELSYRITFYYFRCIVQDLRTGQELGTGHKVGRMISMDNLCLPPIAVVSIVAAAAAVSSIPSLTLWHF